MQRNRIIPQRPPTEVAEHQYASQNLIPGFRNEKSSSRRRSNCMVSSPRLRSTTTTYISISSLASPHRCTSHREMAVSGDRLLRRRYSSRELLKRALAPPVHRSSQRWWNFRPTPSRLSRMST
ncbi:hypothetical protein FRX31_017406 [Thalictrum thalictroides]|uniref:Uncharacterized protein n=1 Tax=Thalictrum thalictroides TaxID=46969 RepID=A0A7J6W7U5_THATH|nr:hypothetical protein FRX31_017406 [Thalictrum thalictroides]